MRKLHLRGSVRDRIDGHAETIAWKLAEPHSVSVDGETFIRVVGSRRTREIGDAPSKEDRDRLAQMARYRTRAPKGVFIYASHQEANEARERWQVEAVVARQAER